MYLAVPSDAGQVLESFPGAASDQLAYMLSTLQLLMHSSVVKQVVTLLPVSLVNVAGGMWCVMKIARVLSIKVTCQVTGRPTREKKSLHFATWRVQHLTPISS